MKEPVLVIMAAGMGSRFGGLKQITPIDDSGHMIIDFSMYDAWRAGFRKVVFIIKREIEADFKAAVGTRVERFFDVRYVYQELEKLPQGFTVPEGRTKPWGTAHAIACARDAIDGPFAVLNSDDYYGPTALQTIYDFLKAPHRPNEHAMVGYLLRNTVTENGYVSRGVCGIRDGYLTEVVERLRIEKRGSDAAYSEDGGKTYIGIPGDTVVSMNLWGFQEELLDQFVGRFPAWLEENLPRDPLKCEYFLPYVANKQLEEGIGTIQVLTTPDVWHGMTYPQDLLDLKEAISQMRTEGLYPPELWMEPAAAYHFPLEGAPFSIEAHGCGHVNSTFLLTTTTGRRYILQRISPAFHVEKLMHNIEAVTRFIAQHNGNADATMHLVPALDGKSYYEDNGSCYRLYDYLEHAVYLQVPEGPEDFYQCAVAFGSFLQIMSAFPVDALQEPIPNFHNTPDRYRLFHQVLEKDPCGRVSDTAPEIGFALEREKEAGVLQTLREHGDLPVRVTHNDTKLNNVMLDADTHRALCVIDLDTVMPGLSLYDFGDAIRFGASTAAEDEPDLDRVTLDLELFRAFTRGFLDACPSLTAREISLLPMGAKIMTLECGVRFLTDYLDGDHYFSIRQQNQNLLRARTQFKLVSEMERLWSDMERIIKEESVK